MCSTLGEASRTCPLPASNPRGHFPGTAKKKYSSYKSLQTFLIVSGAWLPSYSLGRRFIYQEAVYSSANFILGNSSVARLGLHTLHAGFWFIVLYCVGEVHPDQQLQGLMRTFLPETFRLFKKKRRLLCMARILLNLAEFADASDNNPARRVSWRY